jgi:hypothetical protein
MIELYGYETFPQTRTFDTYNDVDCFNYSDVHDYIKYIKHGYGKVTDHVCREIRLRRMTREQGMELVKKYTPIKPRNLKLFLDWIGMTENSFHFIIDMHRNKKLWRRSDKWEWELTEEAIPEDIPREKIEKARLPMRENSCNFVLTKLKKPDYIEDKYILIGKGFPGK